jgi:hypothetical protein
VPHAQKSPARGPGFAFGVRISSAVWIRPS